MNAIDSDLQQKNHVIRINTSKIFAPLKSFAILDVNDIDPISRSSYLELIKAQKVKNLPYVLALVQDQNTPNTHYFDGFSILQWHKLHQVNPVTGKNISHIFYFSISCVESFHSNKEKIHVDYLAKSTDNESRLNFLNQFFNASNGCSEAQFYLGIFYDQGLGTEKNYNKAANWWKIAAEQGHMEAQFHLGHNYFHGEGVEQDLKKMIKLWKSAALLGHLDATTNLIICYQAGIGTKKNLEKALKHKEIVNRSGRFIYEWQ